MKNNYLLSKMNRVVAGDHLVLLYEDKNVKLNIEIIANYLISRINKNEKCFYIYDEIDIELILKRLRKSIEVDKVINSGQLSILNKSNSYSKDGKFVPQKMIALLKEKATQAISEGYNAFAITGEISWVLEYDDGFERIMNYEYLLNSEIFGSYPVSAICRYNINKFSSSMIKNIIEVHPIIIWNGQVHENPFYFSVVDTENLDIENYQVKSMLKAIENYTLDKSRFRDKIENQEIKYHELELSALNNMIATLTGLLGIHDKYTENHSQNVAGIAKKIAENMDFTQQQISQIYYAGLVHDIGKALIPVEIINKNGKLTNEEYEKVKEHPTIGYKALLNSTELTNIANIVLEHHERWDGRGYPQGIKEEDICVESRILAIADSFDAMTSDRSYRKAFSVQQAITEIENNIGNQFDPVIARVAIDKVFNNLEN